MGSLGGSWSSQSMCESVGLWTKSHVLSSFGIGGTLSGQLAPLGHVSLCHPAMRRILNALSLQHHALNKDLNFLSCPTICYGNRQRTNIPTSFSVFSKIRRQLSNETVEQATFALERQHWVVKYHTKLFSNMLLFPHKGTDNWPRTHFFRVTLFCLSILDTTYLTDWS